MWYSSHVLRNQPHFVDQASNHLERLVPGGRIIKKIRQSYDVRPIESCEVYYNTWRTHRRGAITGVPKRGGLHHAYVRI